MPFRDLVGHRRLLGLLSRSIAHDTLPPSLIFSGPDGVGKTHAALATAQALNCLNPVRGEAPGPGGVQLEHDACGECAACGRITRNNHPDVRRLVPGETGSIKVDDVRPVIDEATYRPFEGRRRVVLIEDAERMVGSAQNALLKTLEEPRPLSVFILIASRADALLPTVRSRCSRLRFGRLTLDEVATVLGDQHDYSPEDARAAAALSDGRVGRALALRAAEYVAARHLALDLLRGLEGHGGRGRPDPVRARLESAKVLTAKAAGKAGGRGAGKGAGGRRPAKGTKAAQQAEVSLGLRNERDRVGLHLDVLSSLLRDVGVLTTGADTQLLANLDLESDLATLAGQFDGQRAVRAFTAVDRAQEALGRSVSPKVVADWLALQL